MTTYTGDEWVVFARISECGTEIRGLGVETKVERFKYVQSTVVLFIAANEQLARDALDKFSALLSAVPTDNFRLRSHLKWLPDEQMRVAHLLAGGASIPSVAAAVERTNSAIAYWCDGRENKKLIEQSREDSA